MNDSILLFLSRSIIIDMVCKGMWRQPEEYRIGVNKLRKLCLLFVFSLILTVIFFFISKIK